MAKLLRAKQPQASGEVMLELEDDNDGDIRLVDDEGSCLVWNSSVYKPSPSGGTGNYVRSICVNRAAWREHGYEVEISG